ncbi:hypothetical protein NPIL_240642 [Nephila pilipes]|uniref:Uncharacterized protein n=1 Tax=Nephila pilipes TaxID=299642 RepID=A0A8X6UHP3_NEPPI|nr:hypothetical protein NPIL_240642 [Nephila pilipes]
MMGRNSIILIFLSCCVASFLVETIEASKETKLAKKVAKFYIYFAYINVIERKIKKSYARRWLIIILLVLGGVALTGLAVFGFYMCRRLLRYESPFKPSIV